MKRKVRTEFDKTKGYSVDVSECTEEEKKEVQQAFFDAGFPWLHHGEAYKYIDAVKYTNTTYGLHVITAHLMHGSTTKGCNMTAKEFLELVYEQGHVHAESMALYAQDAKTHSEPWKLWQVKCSVGFWYTLEENPSWCRTLTYRRKPKTKLIHGVEVPVFEFTPKVGEEYYVADVGTPEFFEQWHKPSEDSTSTQRMIERGLIYPYTEEGKQAAIIHAKAMLCIA